MPVVITTMVDLTEVSWNFYWLLEQVMASLDEVLARPLKIPVRSPKQRQRRLTRAEIAELVAAYQGGADMKDLAQHYQVHRTTVANHLYESSVELGGPHDLTDASLDPFNSVEVEYDKISPGLVYGLMWLPLEGRS